MANHQASEAPQRTHGTQPAQALRDGYRAKKAALLQTVQASGASTRGIRRLLQQLAGLADEALRALWDHAGFPPGFALIAVGGFGRGELFPHSDVDVLLLMPDGVSPDADEALKRKLEGFIGSCWDSGLEIGSSVRTLADCVAEAAKDVTVQTSLLESRLVAGNRRLYGQFARQFEAGIDPQAFFVAKTLELRQRHTKFENTPYSLEPNCKESPGGLRDLQVILWVAKAAGFGKTWDELAKSGLATPFEALQIKRNEALLSLIRARLHLLAHRREDRLVFDLQTAVAESFGYTNDMSPDGRLVARAQRGADEALLLGGQGRDPAQPDPAAEHRGTAEPQHPRAAPDQRPFFGQGRHAGGGQRRPVPEEPARDPGNLFAVPATVGIKGLSARTLRALYNARDVMDAASSAATR
jgi:[protein-PII] uridylyltransferase